MALGVSGWTSPQRRAVSGRLRSPAQEALVPTVALLWLVLPDGRQFDHVNIRDRTASKIATRVLKRVSYRII